MLQNFFSHAPWLQIAVATIVYFAFGAVWYMPKLFGNYWAEKHGIVMNEESKKRMPMIMIGTLVVNFVMVLSTGILLHVTQSPGACVAGIKAGLLVSGAFCALPIGINYMYTAKPMKLWIIDAGYHVIGITLTAIILSVWH